MGLVKTLKFPRPVRYTQCAIVSGKLRNLNNTVEFFLNADKRSWFVHCYDSLVHCYDSRIHLFHIRAVPLMKNPTAGSRNISQVM